MGTKKGSKRGKKEVEASGAEASASTECSLEQVAMCFQEVHKSSAEAYKKKKELMQLWERSPASCATCIAGVVLLVLKQTSQLPAEVLKRHYNFLESVAKTALTTPCESKMNGPVEKDKVAIEVISTILPFHNANDKAVRHGIVATIEVLLKAVDQENTTEERQDLYQKIAEGLKFRIHDRCPKVRERAIAAVAVFQVGKRDCDVTQQFMALLCTDSSADVRRQILRCIVGRKEFLEGYFHGMVRCTRDVVARVRSEAWDALARFPWRYVTAYASAKSVHFALLLHQGLSDSSASVHIACKSAMTSSWLSRDCKGDCNSFLDPIVSGYPFETLSPYEAIAAVLFESHRQSHPKLSYQLNLSDINTSSLLMWKAECKSSSDRVDEDLESESSGPLISLEVFSNLFFDVVNCYTRPDAPLTVAKFRSVDDADNMLQIVLSMLEIYREDGYLAHADNTTRQRLLKTIGFLLKVVPDENPSCFVDGCIGTLKELSARAPEEAMETVTAALDSLFRSLKLPQKYAFGFEDVEAFGRKSKEQMQELLKRKILWSSGKCDKNEYLDLSAEIERDEKFLLRIQYIAWSYLSNSERGDEVPAFCAHVIQLGRHSTSPSVQSIAFKSLGLQCLIKPETVHTFLPLILSPASSGAKGMAESLAATAFSVVIDLVMEYGFGFFRIQSTTNRGKSNPTDNESFDEENPTEENRLMIEKRLGEEDDYKVGSERLQELILASLHPSSSSKTLVSILGCCKLLSANRFPKEKVSIVLGFLLLHHCQFQSEGKEHTLSMYMISFLDKFFRSYVSSHARRQEDLVSGGLATLNFLFLHGADPVIASKLLASLLRLGDAFLLRQIREIDPDIGRLVKDQEAEDSQAGDTASSRSSANLSIRSSATRASMQSGRILKELCRHSQHERVAEYLLAFLDNENIGNDYQKICLDALEKNMYFYGREASEFIIYFTGDVIKRMKNDELKQRLSLWLEDFLSRFTVLPVHPDSDQIETHLKSLMNEVEPTTTALEKNGAGDFDFLVCKNQDVSSVSIPSPRTTVKVESDPPKIRGSKRNREEEVYEDPFGVSNIIATSSRKKSY